MHEKPLLSQQNRHWYKSSILFAKQSASNMCYKVSQTVICLPYGHYIVIFYNFFYSLSVYSNWPFNSSSCTVFESAYTFFYGMFIIVLATAVSYSCSIITAAYQYLLYCINYIDLAVCSQVFSLIFYVILFIALLPPSITRTIWNKWNLAKVSDLVNYYKMMGVDVYKSTIFFIVSRS